MTGTMPTVASQSDAAALRAVLHETMGRAVVGQLQVIDGLYIAVVPTVKAASVH